MNRKEMVYAIKTLLDNLNGICTNKVRAEAILGEIERRGMLPPFTEKLVKYETRYKGERDFCESVERVNAWDD